jgi:hypothetical protein
MEIFDGVRFIFLFLSCFFFFLTFPHLFFRLTLNRGKNFSSAFLCSFFSVESFSTSFLSTNSQKKPAQSSLYQKKLSSLMHIKKRKCTDTHPQHKTLLIYRETNMKNKLLLFSYFWIFLLNFPSLLNIK